MTRSRTHRTIDAVWRIESAKIIAALTRIVGDLARAEDFAQDALVAALERWPESGIPDNPGAWLMTTAKRRAIDHLRRNERLERKHEELARELEVRREPVESELDAVIDDPVGDDLLRRNQRLERKHEELAREREVRREPAESEPDAAIDDPVGDDLLRLIFMCCHPVLSREARVALTLRVLGGLTTEEIASAFLVPVPTLAQRIVRAKRILREERIPFEIPRGPELDVRLASVLEVIYLIFNEGYAATSGDDWIRPELCEDALRLGRILAELTPEEPEVHGLVALMEIQASRLRARVGPSGAPILLLDQDRSRWDQLLIRRGLAALERAEQLGGALGPYVLQAAIAACHARARTAEETDWARIAALYDGLAQVTPSPVVELNRAVAIGMASGPEAGLEHIDKLTSEPSLENYHLLSSVRGDFLEKLGRLGEAREEFERAAALTQNTSEPKLLLERAAACERESALRSP